MRAYELHRAPKVFPVNMGEETVNTPHNKLHDLVIRPMGTFKIKPPKKKFDEKKAIASGWYVPWNC